MSKFIDIGKSIKSLNNENGSVLVVVAILIIVLIAFVALVVDMGALYEERRLLQATADAAALAGVQELKPPSDLTSAATIAQNYVNLNITHTPQTNISFLNTYASRDTIKVDLTNPNTPLYFARIFGSNTSTVRATATAVVTSPTIYSNKVMPFGIMAKDESATNSFGYIFGEQVVLKQQSGNGSKGNYQIISTQAGNHEAAGTIFSAIAGGGVPMQLGNYYTRTGLNGGNIEDSINAWLGGDSHVFADLKMNGDFVKKIGDHDNPLDCHRLIVAPIIVDPAFAESDPNRYKWGNITGQSKEIQVIGFAYFFIINADQIDEVVEDTADLLGLFVRVVGASEAKSFGQASETGAIIYRLID